MEKKEIFFLRTSVKFVFLNEVTVLHILPIEHYFVKAMFHWNTYAQPLFEIYKNNLKIINKFAYQGFIEYSF